MTRLNFMIRGKGMEGVNTFSLFLFKIAQISIHFLFKLYQFNNF